MKLGIMGLPQSGKTTLFETLTGEIAAADHRRENRIGTIRVPDPRVDELSRMYQPKKTVFAQVEYFLPGSTGKPGENVGSKIRDCDALIHVIRNFKSHGGQDPTPADDFLHLNQELILADLLVVEKKLENIRQEIKRGRKINFEEAGRLEDCFNQLEGGMPLRKDRETATARILKGYAFLSVKPMLVVFNNDDENCRMPENPEVFSGENRAVIRGRLEHELAQLSEEDAVDFRSDFRIDVPATHRVIKKSYELLGLISYFTVGDDEVKAWTIKKNTDALNAADVIHSDIKKGFIRAEVVSHHDLMEAGSYQNARKKGAVRLEGKSYRVRDGDIINFLFNV